MEIEAKFQLDEARTQALRARLGAPAETIAQRDVYLETAGLPVALRVRSDGHRAFVTLKQGFEKVAGIRVREEFEPAITPGEIDTWLTIFARLGFPAGDTVAKTRAVHHRPGDVHVLIDEIAGLGTFCEVEAVADDRDAALAKLEHAIAELGLNDLPRLTRSYRELQNDAQGRA